MLADLKRSLGEYAAPMVIFGHLGSMLLESDEHDLLGSENLLRCNPFYAETGHLHGLAAALAVMVAPIV